VLFNSKEKSMTRIKQAGPPIVVVALIAGILGYILGCSKAEREEQTQAKANQPQTTDEQPETGPESAQTEKGEPLISPTEARERDFYAPNSETLDPNEIRVIALGTGMPTPRPFQAAACFLMELGNGDKFIFDIGDGSGERLFALQIPTAFLDKVFIGHLHADHFGDIGSLFVSAGLAGRFTPLRIWGPSGAKPELGTKAAIEAMEKMYAWDLAGRLGQTDVRGFTTDIHEFD
jgi:ribonuclease Z